MIVDKRLVNQVETYNAYECLFKMDASSKDFERELEKSETCDENIFKYEEKHGRLMMCIRTTNIESDPYLSFDPEKTGKLL